MRRRILAASLVALLGIVGISVLLRRADDLPPGSPPRDLAAVDLEVPAPKEVEPTTPELATSVPSAPGSPVASVDTLQRPAPPESPPAIEPFSESPGLRFEAHFTDWRAPYIPGARSWRVVGFRESLTGCRRVSPYALRREIGPMVYRIDLDQGLGRPADVDGKISLAVFLLAAPIDARGNPIGGHLVAHSAEAHLAPRDLEKDPRAYLRSRAGTIDFSVEFAEAPEEAVARGWFEHAAIEERWPAAELPRRLAMSFPAFPEMFANDAGGLRFAGARFEAQLSVNGRLDVVGWPRGMRWPLSIEFRAARASPDIWALVEPKSLRFPSSTSSSSFDPQPVTLHRYERPPGFFLPPIEVAGARQLGEFLEDAVVFAFAPGLSAEARISPETGLWGWSVSRALRGDSHAFHAVLLLPGASPTLANGRTHSDEPLIFRPRPEVDGAMLGTELIVTPDLRLDIPVYYQLELTHRRATWSVSGEGFARSGIFTLGNLPRGWEGKLVVEVDGVAWARMIESEHLRKWNRALMPLEVNSEVIGSTPSGATVLEVTVDHGGDLWPLAEFLVEFDLRP